MNVVEVSRGEVRKDRRQSSRWWTLTILFFFSHLLFPFLLFLFWRLRVRVNMTSQSHCHT